MTTQQMLLAYGGGTVLFHDSFNGTGTLDAHTADTGQAWDPTNEDPELVNLSGGVASAVSNYGGGPNAAARIPLGPYSLTNFDWTTVVTHASDGYPVLDDGVPQYVFLVYGDAATSLYAYVGFRIKPWAGGTCQFMTWPNNNVTSPDPSFALDVAHTVKLTVRGTTVKWYLNGVLVATETISAQTISAMFIDLSTTLNYGRTYQVLDSLLVRI